MTIEEIKAKFEGRLDEPRVLIVEKGAIQRYAQAIGDPNPIYHDEDYARKLGYRSIVAPLGFFGWPAKPAPALDAGRGLMGQLGQEIVKAGYPGILDGGVEYEVFHPICAGDMLVAVPRVESVTARETKAGAMVFRVTATDFVNQNGDLAVKARSTGISRKLG